VSRYVAFLRHTDGAEFALVPGGEVVLGYDPSHAPAFDETALESWANSMAEYGFPALAEHLATVMLPRRTARLPALMVETSARPVESVAPCLDHAELLSTLKKEGFRLLTSDEWEHACAAGTRSLWRWGEACPTDEEPYGEVRFSELKKPNAFGLNIAQNPYNSEFLMEPRRFRGGDGGEAVCGGYGYLAAWLTCASAYLWPWFDTDGFSAEWADGAFVRRVVPVS
jgi:hypothetical protein